MHAAVRWSLGSLAALAAAGGAWAYWQYRREIGPRRAQVRTNSRVIQTHCGPIEYATAGQGEPLLAIHGAGGGYDQGLWIARQQAKTGFWVIAPSRFGYLRTPLPADASAVAQADAHACLLDALGVKKTAVIAASAGAPSAVQLALRYPERVSALVLISPAAAYPGQAPVGRWAPPYVYSIFLKSDFAFWLASKIAHNDLVQLLGVPPSVRGRMTAQQAADVDELMQAILPISQRQAGLDNDSRVVSSLSPYPVAQVATPTLLVAAPDDPMQTLGGAEYMAQQMPNAHLVVVPTGGHLLVGQEAAYEPTLQQFLARYAAGQPAVATTAP